jgi:mannose-6-phosphate isomerase-like protein (cupin superfamily)
MQAQPLETTFLVMDTALNVHAMPVTPTLYQDLDRRFQGFHGCALIAEYRFDSDWPTWEIHPHGDEILYLLAGQAEMHMQVDGQLCVAAFTEIGSAMIIPKNTWHTAKILSPCRILFITPGEATENLAVPPV